MKSVAIARSGFGIKDDREYVLIWISFSRLILLAVCLIAPFGKSESSGTVQSSRDRRFYTSTSRSLLTDSTRENSITLVFILIVSLLF